MSFSSPATSYGSIMILQLRPIKERYFPTQDKYEHVKNASFGTEVYDESSRVKRSVLISDDDPTLKHQWKPVSHQTWEATGFTQGSYVQYENWADYLNGEPPYYHVTRGHPIVPYLVLQDLANQLSMEAQLTQPPDWDTIARAVVPSLRNEFNTINALLELDDITNLPATFRKMRDSAQKNADLLKKGKRREARKGFSRLGVDAFLQHNLGIVPLISEAETLNDNLFGLFTSLSERARKIERAMEYIERGLKASVLRPYSPVIDVDLELPWGDNSIARLRVTGYAEVRDHIRVKGSFGYPNPFARFLDTAGLYPDLHTVWNAIPFSFLVDYVVPIGKVLETEYGQWSWQTVGLPGGGLRLVDAWTSVKIRLDFSFEEWFAKPPGPVSNGISPAVLTNLKPAITSGYFKRFERFKVEGAVLDGVDLRLSDKDRSTKFRQASISSGILANGYESKKRRIGRSGKLL